MFKRLREDIQAVRQRDPAARSTAEILLCYPGLHAVLLYRMASALWRGRLFLLGRLVSHFARWLTGVEIHPGARIGRRLFIDHGMGVVIGETAEIGDDVTLYHDVTLGGVSPAVDSSGQRDRKRHPTLQDRVIVGSGAQILGPIVIGAGARVGANAVVTKEVAAGATVVGVPGRAILQRARSEEAAFSPYGTPLGDLPDPTVRAIDGLVQQINALSARVAELERQLADQAVRQEVESRPNPSASSAKVAS